MNAVINLDPSGIYTGAQAIRATGIDRKTFYRWVKAGKIPFHIRLIDGRKVYKGRELIKILTDTLEMGVPNAGEFFRMPRRGRPKKKIG